MRNFVFIFCAKCTKSANFVILTLFSLCCNLDRNQNRVLQLFEHKMFLNLLGNMKFLIFNIFTHAKSVTLKWKIAPPFLQATNSEGFKGTCYYLNFDQKCFKSEPCSPTFRAQNVSKFTRKYEIFNFEYLHTCQICNIKMKNSPPPLFTGHEFRGF